MVLDEHCQSSKSRPPSPRVAPGGLRKSPCRPAIKLAAARANEQRAVMKFGICNEIFQGWKLEDAMAFAKRAGYDGIEIAPFTLAKYVTDIPAVERTRIRDVASRLEIEIAGIHWVLVQAEGM